MKTFHEYIKQQESLEELPAKLAGTLVSGGVGAVLGGAKGLGKGLVNALKDTLGGAWKGGKNFAKATWKDGEDDEKGNPKFQRKMGKK